EVAAAATHRPEQVGMVGRTGRDHLAVRRDDFDRADVVNRQAILAREPADAAAQRQPAYSDGCVIAGRESQPVRMERRRDLAPGEARAQSRYPRLRIDFKGLHQREIEDDAALDDAVAGETVAAAAHRQFERMLAGKRDG